MSSFLFWQRWLSVAGMIMSALGIGMALVSETPPLTCSTVRLAPLFGVRTVFQ